MINELRDLQSQLRSAIFNASRPNLEPTPIVWHDLVSTTDYQGTKKPCNISVARRDCERNLLGLQPSWRTGTKEFARCGISSLYPYRRSCRLYWCDWKLLRYIEKHRRREPETRHSRPEANTTVFMAIGTTLKSAYQLMPLGLIHLLHITDTQLVCHFKKEKSATVVYCRYELVVVDNQPTTRQAVKKRQSQMDVNAKQCKAIRRSWRMRLHHQCGINSENGIFASSVLFALHMCRETTLVELISSVTTVHRMPLLAINGIRLLTVVV